MRREGKPIAWFIYDPATDAFVMRCKSRAEAYELAGHDGVVTVVRRYR
jgi:hypothetical protein